MLHPTTVLRFGYTAQAAHEAKTANIAKATTAVFAFIGNWV
jgi:hypothetical protein